MTEPTTEAYEKARAAYDRVVIARGAYGHRAGHADAIHAAVDAVWSIAIAEGRRAMVEEIFHPDPDLDLTPPTAEEARAEAVNLARRVAGDELIAEGRMLAARAIRAVQIIGDRGRSQATRLRDWYADIAEGVDGDG